MDRNTAWKTVQRLLGKAAYVHENQTAPRDEETRLANLAQFRSKVDAVKRASEAVEARRTAVLAADVEYQDALAAWRKAKEDRSALAAGTEHRFEAGTIDKIAGGLIVRHPRAYACNLQGLVDKLKAAKEQKAAS